MCTQICSTLGTFILITMFLPVSQFPSDHGVMNVNGPMLLTCSKPCSGDVKWMLAKRPEVLVTECKRGHCVEGQGFENRTRLEQRDSALHLNPVMYNDKGWYICYCNHSKISQFYLDVVFPYLKSACIGETVNIPCYADTDKRVPDNDTNVQWQKDGKLVVKLQWGKMSYGPGLEDRGFVIAGQYKHGDLSLTICKLQQSDGGIYRCLHRHEKPGQPDAISLSIRECEATQQSTFPWWKGLLLAAILAGLGGLVGYVIYKLIHRKRLQRDGTDDEISSMTIAV